MPRIETIRSQVSDRDPQYIEARRQSLEKADHEIFCASNVSMYEERSRALDRSENNLKLHENRERELETLLSDNPQDDDLLKRLDETRKDIKNTKKRRTALLLQNKNAFYEEFETLLFRIAEIQRTNPDSLRSRFLGQEIANIFFDSEYIDEIRPYLGDDLENLSSADLWLLISQRKIPSHVLYRIAKRHNELMQERKEACERIFEEYKAEFLEAVKNGVKEGWLPVSLETVEHRLKMVKVHLTDRLIDPASTGDGSHFPDGNIKLSTEQFVEERRDLLRGTIFHELLHEISGKSLHLTISKEEGDDESIDAQDVYIRVRDRKSGVRILSKRSFARFTWLNEALTEWLALRLAGSRGNAQDKAYKGSDSYPDERRELDRLFDKGLREDIALKAYFENIDDEEGEGQKGEHFGNLLRAIREIEDDKSAFPRMENLFLLHGITDLLKDRGFKSSTSLSKRKNLPPGTVVHEITLAFGTRSDNTVEEKLSYVIRPQEEDLDIAPEEQYQKMEKALLEQARTYKKTRFRYTISEPHAFQASA